MEGQERMPTPVGHGLAGAIISTFSRKKPGFRAGWRWVLVCVVLAALADIDFAPALFGRLGLANSYHRQVTHTLLFCVVVFAAAVLLLKAFRIAGVWQNSFVLFCCSLSHILLDLLGTDTRPPIGLPFLWPLVGRSFKIPIELFPALKKNTYAEIFSLRTVWILGYEIVVFGSILLLLAVYRKRRRGRRDPLEPKSEAIPCKTAMLQDNGGGAL
jgi:membrane-bound metal-dependent hydrolase YbcI (DUF457 family)